jgi:aminobenzoyl-glutamate utilization protein B
MNKNLFLVKTFFVLVMALLCSMQTMAQKKYTEKDLAALKQTLMQTVAGKSKEVQVMVDQIFSFAELGFQEIETSKYITSVLTKNGFTVENGISNVPTAWMAKWGTGSPVIALGSDVDCIPKASQKPGVAYKAPIVEGAPGHGEGHNSGQAVIIYAAIAMKELMEREKLPGTILIWPGIAEELVGTKAWYVRDGYFKNVDACIFTHVSGDFTFDGSW